jgi:hypothetical protein
MSFAAKVLPLAAVAVSLIAACSDASSPTEAISAPTSAAAKKGGDSKASESTAQLVITTPPTVNVTGQWVGTDDRFDNNYTFTYTLAQRDDGIVTGVGVTTTGFMTATSSIVGTVNGDTLMLDGGSLQCSSCGLVPSYRGIVSSSGSRIEGSYLSGGSAVTLVKQ